MEGLSGLSQGVGGEAFPGGVGTLQAGGGCGKEGRAQRKVRPRARTGVAEEREAVSGGASGGSPMDWEAVGRMLSCWGMYHGARSDWVTSKLPSNPTHPTPPSVVPPKEAGAGHKLGFLLSSAQRRRRCWKVPSWHPPAPRCQLPGQTQRPIFQPCLPRDKAAVFRLPAQNRNPLRKYPGPLRSLGGLFCLIIFYSFGCDFPLRVLVRFECPRGAFGTRGGGPTPHDGVAAGVACPGSRAKQIPSEMTS